MYKGDLKDIHLIMETQTNLQLRFSLKDKTI